MPYVANARLVRALKGAWIDAEDLRDFMATAEMNSFAYVSGRNSTIQAWGKIKRKAPCSRDTRFDDWDCYVYIDDGDWPGKITQMLTALNYREASEQGQLSNDKNETGKIDTKAKGKMKTDTHDAESSEQASSAMVGQNEHNKALLSFYTAIRRMKDQLAKGDNVHDRTSFEKHFDAIWRDSA